MKSDDYPLFDTHCHLSLLGKKPDLTYVIERAHRSGIGFLLDISVRMEDFLERRDLIDGLSREGEIVMGVAEGIAPFYSDRRREGDVRELESHLRSYGRVRALGEIGLDYFHGYATRARQIELFSDQLALADTLGLPVIIHNRDADGDVLRLLGEYAPSKGGVIHCFSSGPEAAVRFLDLGYFLSFAGNVTYPKSENLREALRLVPEDRLLVETDSPYLSPQGRRGTSNEPANLVETARFIAECRGCSTDDLARRTTENGRRLFGM
jgi:TatD DNase family protein